MSLISELHFFWPAHYLFGHEPKSLQKLLTIAKKNNSKSCLDNLADHLKLPLPLPLAALESLGIWPQSRAILPAFCLSIKLLRYTLGPRGSFAQEIPADFSMEESRSLAKDLAPLLNPGSIIQVASPDQWYLYSHQAPDFVSLPLNFLEPLPALRFRGPQAQSWQRLQTELEMALSLSEVNLSRQRQGQAQIQGLWISGEGCLPSTAETCSEESIWSDQPLAQGLAKLKNLPLHPWPENLAELFKTTNSKICLLFSLPFCHTIARHQQDLLAWQDFWEQQWFAPLLLALKTRRLKKLMIYVEDQSFSISGPYLKWFWILKHVHKRTITSIAKSAS